VETADQVGAVCEVAIVGLGPVGATLAALLGERGVDVIVIEPAAEPLPYPRAIAADDEMLRTMLRVPGLSEPQRLFGGEPRCEVRDARGALLTTVTFGETALGLPGLSFYHQPSLERELRAALNRVPSVRQRIGAAVASVRDMAGGVRLSLDDGAAITARWVVGCDGAGSLVRRERGIVYSGLTFAEPWVVVDIDTPQPLRHLPCFTYLLDPRRPAVNMPRPGGHRFEFMVLAGEDPAAMTAPEHVNRWLEPYLAPLPAAERARLTTVRVADYTFHVRTAARWRDGRVLLAGDAAHCMPPFGGQGLGAGIGDAAALAWRLDEVRRGLSPPSILDAYEQERRPRVAEMIRTARVAGWLLTATSPPRAAVTRWGLRAINAAPVAGRWFRSGGLRPPPRLPGPKSEHLGGRPLPNPRVRTQDGGIVRLDDVLPAGWAVLGLGSDPWQFLGGEFGAALAARDCRALVVCPPGGLAAVAAGSAVPAVEDLDGTLLALWAGLKAGVALVRPDRFLGAVGDEAHVSAAFERLTGRAVPPRTCTAVQAP
jgi:3-(3-hydroxy-phenyl)propionate hydroxylase